MSIQVQNLSLGIRTPDGLTEAVSNVSFELSPGKVLGLVGESGCGKTITAQSLLRLNEHQGIERSGGQVLFDACDIDTLSPEQLRNYRGGQVGMVFQEPMTALNPVFTVGFQLMHVIKIHQDLSDLQIEDKARQLLDEVGLRDTRQLLQQYPDALSGGMRQRVLIAMAMAGDPDYLIADEPTTALDVSVQKRIVKLLQRLLKERNMGMLLVTHDFGLVAELADEVAVMYAGEIVEFGNVQTMFDHPAHPYTRALMACRPEVVKKGELLPAIDGNVPRPGRWPVGCHFANRCAFSDSTCSQQAIPLDAWQKSTHAARCVRVEASMEALPA